MGSRGMDYRLGPAAGSGDYRRQQERRRNEDADYLTPFEKELVLKTTVLGIFSNLTWGLMNTALNTKLMAIANNDPIAIAKANSIHWSANAAMQLFIRPLGAAASDRFGRRYFIAAQRLTTIAYHLGSLFMTSLNHYVITCIVCWGFLSPLTSSGEAAAWSDVFGERPELSARIRAKYTVLPGAVGSLIFPLVGAYVNHRSEQSSHPVIGGGNLGFICAMACAILQTGIALTVPETCPDEEGRAKLAAIGQTVAERKPFSLLVANPISNALILFRNGPGLRGLAMSSIWFQSVGTIGATMEPYRLSYIGWSPSQQSMYDSLMGGLRIPMAFVTQYLLRIMGNKRSFYGTSLATGVGHIIIGQSARPISASVLQKTIQYTSGDVLEHVFTNPLDDMIVKQGRVVTNLGVAQIQAAKDGIGSIIGIVTPVVWSRLFEFFANQPQAGIVYLIMGPGGHCVVAGLSRLLAAYSCWRIDDKDLFIADADDVAQIKQRLGLPGADYRKGLLPSEESPAALQGRGAGGGRFDARGFQLPVLATDA